MKRIKLISLILLLVLVDQGIKVYIKCNIIQMNFNIIGEYVQFSPHINKDYSWINSLLGLGLGRGIHIFFLLIVFAVLYVLYGFVTMYHRSIFIQIFAICIFSGTICSTLDKIFWNGSLDYILLKGLFIFDLKDVYISIFEVFAILMCIMYYKEIKAWDGREIGRSLIEYIRLKKIKNKARL